MKKSRLIHQIIHLGTQKEPKAESPRNVRLLNALSLVLLLITLLSALSMVFFKDYTINNLTLDISLAVVYTLPVFALNHIGKFELARVYFIGCGIGLLTYLVIDARHNNIYIAEAENIMIGFSVATVFLFSRLRMIVLFLANFIWLLVLSYWVMHPLKSDFNPEFYHNVQNYAFAYLLIFVFTNAYKMEARRALQEKDSALQKLKEQNSYIAEEKKELEKTLAGTGIHIWEVDLPPEPLPGSFKENTRLILENCYDLEGEIDFSDQKRIEKTIEKLGEDRLDFGLQFKVNVKNETRFLRSRAVIRSRKHPIKIQGITIDVTEQKNTEQRLFKSESKFKDIFNSVFGGIYLIHKNQFRIVNKAFCKITGYTREELISPDFDFKSIVLDNQTRLGEILDLRSQGISRPFSYEIGIKTKQGKVKYLQINSVLIGDPSDENILGITLDVTRHRLLEKQLEEKNKTLLDIAHHHSHKLRGPVARLLGIIQVVRTVESFEEANQFIQLLEPEIIHLDNIIKNTVQKTQKVQKVSA